MKELKLWQEAVALAADAVRLGRAGAKRETKAVTERLMLAAADVPTRIAAGYSHDDPSARLEFYLRARQALVELETLLALGRQAGLLPADAVPAVSARASTVHRLLAGYVAYLDRQVTDSGAPTVAQARVSSPGAA